MNNEIKMKIISDNSLNMKLTDSKAIDMNVSSTGKEVDPIFRDSPAYTITYNDITYWNDKSNFSGNYNDLTNKPVIPTRVGQLSNDIGYVTKNVNNLANYTLSTNISEVGLTGNYSDLLDAPTIPTKTSDLDNDSGFIDNTVNDLTNYTLTSNLATVATTGDYSDLLNSPTLATVATTGVYSDLLNKPTLATVASTGDYDDLIDKPTIPVVPTDISAFNNDVGYITNTVNDLTNYTLSSSLATVATSGDYDDLLDKPTIPVIDSSVSTTSTNGVENQAITNYVDGKFTITTGTGTMSTTMVRSTETNQYIRSGNIITFTFVFTAETGWDNTSTLVSNLPTPKLGMRFLGLNGSTNVPLRFALNTSGELKNWYSYTKPSGGQVVEVTGTYITTD